MRKLAAGNWKMNGSLDALAEVEALMASNPKPGCDVLICPPAVLIHPMVTRVRGAGILVGGQDCHHEISGAHTGDISAGQLADVGASHVILGHSERRTNHGETSFLVARKAAAAHAAGLVSIICLGESEAQRDAGATLDVIAQQLEESMPDGANATNTVLAYEPIWAIGTGRVPEIAQIAEVHALLRARVSAALTDGSRMRLLYGGSVKASNASTIFSVPDVDGALVGGASLTAADFGPIVAALGKA
ncbi:MAG: triose-phosphate isomerase [Paracoccus sp. (in: a-proteobacteria)]|nr:triose-phosphate isomerase [Paracoccus sp. (in: a-proteobacteria)]